MKVKDVPCVVILSKGRFLAKFKAKICKVCSGVGTLHKDGEPDRFCKFCPPSRPSVVRKWSPGRACVIDKGMVIEVEGVLVKAPFLNQFREWFVIVVTVGEATHPRTYEYFQEKFNVRILKERVSLS